MRLARSCKPKIRWKYNYLAKVGPSASFKSKHGTKHWSRVCFNSEHSTRPLFSRNQLFGSSVRRLEVPEKCLCEKSHKYNQNEEQTCSGQEEKGGDAESCISEDRPLQAVHLGLRNRRDGFRRKVLDGDAAEAHMQVELMGQGLVAAREFFAGQMVHVL